MNSVMMGALAARVGLAATRAQNVARQMRNLVLISLWVRTMEGKDKSEAKVAARFFWKMEGL
jgi:hypothetical protein